MKVILAKSTLSRTIPIKGNTFKNTVQTPTSDLIVAARFKKLNEFIFSAIGVFDDSTGVQQVFEYQIFPIPHYKLITILW